MINQIKLNPKPIRCRLIEHGWLLLNKNREKTLTKPSYSYPAALGISFVFLKDVMAARPLIYAGFLLGSWVTWGLSAVGVLASFYLSHLALRTAIYKLMTEPFALFINSGAAIAMLTFMGQNKDVINDSRMWIALYAFVSGIICLGGVHTLSYCNRELDFRQ